MMPLTTKSLVVKHHFKLASCSKSKNELTTPICQAEKLVQGLQCTSTPHHNIRAISVDASRCACKKSTHGSSRRRGSRRRVEQPGTDRTGETARQAQIYLTWSQQAALEHRIRLMFACWVSSTLHVRVLCRRGGARSRAHRCGRAHPAGADPERAVAGARQRVQGAQHGGQALAELLRRARRAGGAVARATFHTAYGHPVLLVRVESQPPKNA